MVVDCLERLRELYTCWPSVSGIIVPKILPPLSWQTWLLMLFLCISYDQ